MNFELVYGRCSDFGLYDGGRIIWEKFWGVLNFYGIYYWWFGGLLLRVVFGFVVMIIDGIGWRWVSCWWLLGVMLVDWGVLIVDLFFG